MVEPLLSSFLTPEKALIFRLVHRENVPWILANGLHSASSTTKSPHWVPIGNRELIEKRAQWSVPTGHRGVLNDYVPFYFTPRSPMLGNIHFGQGARKLPNQELVFLVSSLHRLAELEIPFVFTDAHALSTFAKYYDSLTDLAAVQWEILQSSDFKRDPEYPEKFEQYQAEALVYRRCPVASLLGLACFDLSVKNTLQDQMDLAGLSLPVAVRRGWYFT